MAKVVLVIPVLNGWHHTRRCLEAIRSSQYEPLEVIVVDHGSTDDTKRLLPACYPEVMHVLGKPTLWWSGATNLGIRAALARGASAVMLLNNDCYVTPATIRQVMAHLRQLGEAVVAPMQRDALSQEVLTLTPRSCFLLGFPTLPGRRSVAHTEGGPLLETRLIMGGRGVAIPASVFQRVGLFDDEHLPHYGADHDFYLRCRKHGIPLFIALDAVVHVDRKQTTLASQLATMSLAEFRRTLTDRRSHRNIRDLAALFRKHYPIKQLYFVGVLLNLLRYCLVYGWKRLLYLCSLPLSA